MFLLYHTKSAPTGSRLATYLGIDSGTELDAEQPQDVLIRWGSGAAVRRRPQRAVNLRTAITAASDKLTALTLFQEAGVPCPNFSLTAGDLEYPLLRRSRHGAGGRGIKFLMEGDNTRRGDNDFFVEFIDKSAEYRIHVLNGRCIKVQQKVYRPDEATLKRRNPIIWNHDNGYIFTELPNVDVPRRMKVAAVGAVTTLDLHFGAVDIIEDYGGNFYVLEVNTAPGLIPTTLTTYGDALARTLGITPAGMAEVEWPEGTPGLEG